MKILVLLFTALSLLTSAALSDEHIEKWAGAYLCTDTTAGGVVYREKQKKWVGTNFTSFSGSKNHLFNIKFKGRYIRAATKVKGSVYTVSITDTGSSFDQKCLSFFQDSFSMSNDSFSINDGSTFSIQCHTAFGHFLINLRTLRYMNFYSWGYVDGADNNKNTPSVTIGECAKIQ